MLLLLVLFGASVVNLPGALPWQVSDTVTAAIVTTVGAVLVGVMSTIGAQLVRVRREVVEARGHAAAARYQVEKSHATNLRDDFDNLRDYVVERAEHEDARHQTLIAMISATQTMVSTALAATKTNADTLATIQKTPPDFPAD